MKMSNEEKIFVREIKSAKTSEEKVFSLNKYIEFLEKKHIEHVKETERLTKQFHEIVTNPQNLAPNSKNGDYIREAIDKAVTLYNQKDKQLTKIGNCKRKIAKAKEYIEKLQQKEKRRKI